MKIYINSSNIFQINVLAGINFCLPFFLTLCSEEFSVKIPWKTIIKRPVLKHFTNDRGCEGSKTVRFRNISFV